MKRLSALAAAAFLLPMLAHASCDALKSQIDGKLQAKHLTGYTLDVVPADQADSSGGKVVGSCEGDSKKIVYTRGGSSSDAGNGQDAAPSDSAPASASSSG